MLKELYGKHVTITTIDNTTFCGIVDDYIFPKDNEDNKESIILKINNSEFIEFKEYDIASILINS